MKYYLAGPMTGLPNYNFDTFERVSKLLRHGGLDVLSPHEIDHGETEETRGSLQYEVYIRAGLKMLLECDAIILMGGWEASTGCYNELVVAKMCKMKVYFYNTKTNVLSSEAGA